MTWLKIVIAITLSFGFVLKSLAQQVNPFIQNTFGASFAGAEYFVDMSVGGLAVTTIRGNELIITQGFLQPINLKIPCVDQDLRAFPNPVESILTLAQDGCDFELSYVVAYDLFGRKVVDMNVLENNIDFTELGIGVYIVKAFNTENQSVGAIKIVKINK